MADAAVIAVGAVSAFGREAEAYEPGPVGEPARSAIVDDDALKTAGLMRAHCARAPLVGPAGDDRATVLLSDALGQVCEQLDGCRPAWRQQRLRVVIGTSSGGMNSAEQLFRERHDGAPDDATTLGTDPARASYYAPLRAALMRCGLGHVPRTQILAACASSTIAMGLGLRLLDRGACDVVLAGGYDAISVFVAAGFEALRATTASRPRPFRLGRDGMALGEGAGVVAMVHASTQTAARFYVSGFGASADAVHITAPDRAAGGLIRAGKAALADANCEATAVSLVSAHGTATPYNDAAEAKAVAALVPNRPVVHPFKSQIGHTLGAAGVLESLAAASALERQVAPAACGSGSLDPDADVHLLERAEPRPLESALKLSAAFGGVTAALVLRKEPGARAAVVPKGVAILSGVRIRDYDKPALAAALHIPANRMARMDDVTLLCLAAGAALLANLDGVPSGTGVVVGHALATLDTNERFNKRLLKKGARWVDPRLFPATSPNACAGQCAIAWGLTGPNFAVGADLYGGHEAVRAAAEFVAAGDAPAMLVMAVDDAGPAALDWMRRCAPDKLLERGATALLITAAPGTPLGPDDAQPGQEQAVGHLALHRWLLSRKAAII